MAVGHLFARLQGHSGIQPCTIFLICVILCDEEMGRTYGGAAQRLHWACLPDSAHMTRELLASSTVCSKLRVHAKHRQPIASSLHARWADAAEMLDKASTGEQISSVAYSAARRHILLRFACFFFCDFDIDISSVGVIF